MSFLKKLDNFLLQAKEKNIIDANLYKDLQEFAVKSNNKSSINIFIAAIGFLGALAMLAGLILMVSHNWWQISNIIKISSYILGLILFHIAGIAIKNQYPKMSEILHFLGAGYILTGIGLVAQIYNLSSSDGKAFFLWFIMILPMAIILKHRWIGMMSMFSFYLWLNIYLKHHGYYYNSINAILYFTIFATNLILVPKLLNSLNNCFDHMKVIGAIAIAIIIAIMGFSHEIIRHSRDNPIISFHWIVTLILIFNFIVLLHFIIKEQREKSVFGFDTVLSILLIIATLLPLFAGKENLMIISILYWMLHFLFGGFLIYQGGLKANTTYINCGIWYIAIGIFIRFVDIVGTMLFSGSMFILFGLILLTLAFLAEKFRRTLIIKIQKANV